MNWPPEFPPYAAINARLAEVVKHAPSPPAWYAPWSRLDRESSDEERLKVYQAVRDSNLLPEEAGFYLAPGRSTPSPANGQARNCCKWRRDTMRMHDFSWTVVIPHSLQVHSAEPTDVDGCHCRTLGMMRIRSPEPSFS